GGNGAGKPPGKVRALAARTATHRRRAQGKSIFPLIFACGLMLAFPVHSAHINDAEATREFDAARPTVGRITHVVDDEDVRLTVGLLKQALMGTPMPPPSKDLELLEHVDPAFTSLGDETVPLRIRLIEFMRQDAARDVESMRKLGQDLVGCKAYANFSAA